MPTQRPATVTASTTTLVTISELVFLAWKRPANACIGIISTPNSSLMPRPRMTPINHPKALAIHAPSPPDTPEVKYLAPLFPAAKAARICITVYVPEPTYQEWPQTGSVSLPRNLHSNQSSAPHFGQQTLTATLSSNGFNSACACGLAVAAEPDTSPLPPHVGHWPVP